MVNETQLRRVRGIAQGLGWLRYDPEQVALSSELGERGEGCMRLWGVESCERSEQRSSTWCIEGETGFSRVGYSLE